MIEELFESYQKQEPIIITGWEPYWIFNELDMKLLEDPDKIFGGTDEHINVVFNKKFEETHPAAYKIITRIVEDWNKDEEEKLMKEIFVEEKNHTEVIENYIDDHSNKVDKWKKNIEVK